MSSNEVTLTYNHGNSLLPNMMSAYIHPCMLAATAQYIKSRNPTT